MATKRKRGGGGRRKKTRTRGQKAVLHLSDLIVILWLCERLGLLSSMFYNKIAAGDVGGAMNELNIALNRNFLGSGIPITVASGIGIGTVLMVLRYALKGHTIMLKKPKGVAV